MVLSFWKINVWYNDFIFNLDINVLVLIIFSDVILKMLILFLLKVFFFL